MIRLGPRSIHGGGRKMDQRKDPPAKRARRRDGDHRGRKGRRTKEMVAIARERMDLLMAQAIAASRSGDMTKADRYVGLARGIGMRYNVRMRPEHRLLICRNCNRLMLPSKTSTVRIVRGRRVTRCLRCGDIRRTPIGAREKGAPSERVPEKGSDEGPDENDERSGDNEQ